MVRRLALFVIVTALLVAAAVWLAERPGQAVIHWLGWKITAPVPVVIGALVALLAAAALLVRLVRAIVGAPGRWLAARRESAPAPATAPCRTASPPSPPATARVPSGWPGAPTSCWPIPR